MNSQIRSIYKTRKVKGKRGEEIKLEAEIDAAEGAFIHRIISQDANITRTLEVGCAYGLSSLHIWDALSSRSNPKHVIIDPFQYSQWDGIGIRNLEEAGIDFFTLIEKRSEFALPELLSRGEATFDLIFIDGWHTFDHTLLECFYATRLLKTGGYLLIDDVTMDSIRRTTEYLGLYPCYATYGAVGEPCPPTTKRRAVRALLRLLPLSKRQQIVHPSFLNRVFREEFTRMLALKKIGEDERNWDWFPNVF